MSPVVGKTPFIIAEAGVNHNGDVARAIDMVCCAAEAGADCVKFQWFDADKLTAEGARTASYQARNTGANDQREMLRALELSDVEFVRIAEECQKRGIEFLCTPFDETAVQRMLDLGMRRIKIASGELTNAPALKRFAEYGLPLILSTGMAVDQEVDEAVDLLKASGADDIVVLQCTTIYPAPPELANLRAMRAMGDRNGVRFGYSDHTLDDHVALAAVALGAEIIEKHFTLDASLPGPDHKASLEPAALALMVRRLRDVAKALGDHVKRPAPEELETAAIVRRSWRAARDLPAGAMLSAEDLILKRPADGAAPSATLVGQRLSRPKRTDEAIRTEDLETPAGALTK